MFEQWGFGFPSFHKAGYTVRAVRFGSSTTVKKREVSDDTEGCDCNIIHSKGEVQVCVNTYTYVAICGGAGSPEGFSFS